MLRRTISDFGSLSLYCGFRVECSPDRQQSLSVPLAPGKIILMPPPPVLTLTHNAVMQHHIHPRSIKAMIARSFLRAICKYQRRIDSFDQVGSLDGAKVRHHLVDLHFDFAIELIGSAAHLINLQKC